MQMNSLSSLIRALRPIGAQLRKPEWIVFVPAVTLAAFWLGGERVLILVALGSPLVFAMAGAFRLNDTDAVDLPDALTGAVLASADRWHSGHRFAGWPGVRTHHGLFCDPV